MPRCWIFFAPNFLRFTCVKKWFWCFNLHLWEIFMKMSEVIRSSCSWIIVGFWSSNVECGKILMWLCLFMGEILCKRLDWRKCYDVWRWMLAGLSYNLGKWQPQLKSRNMHLNFSSSFTLKPLKYFSTLISKNHSPNHVTKCIRSNFNEMCVECF